MTGLGEVPFYLLSNYVPSWCSTVLRPTRPHLPRMGSDDRERTASRCCATTPPRPSPLPYRTDHEGLVHRPSRRHYGNAGKASTSWMSLLPVTAASAVPAKGQLLRSCSLFTTLIGCGGREAQGRRSRDAPVPSQQPRGIHRCGSSSGCWIRGPGGGAPWY
jgi:hypothetical protein